MKSILKKDANVTKTLWNRKANPSTIEESAIKTYYKQFELYQNQGGFNEKEVEAIENIINLCKEVGARPVLLTMPILDEYSTIINENMPEYISLFNNLINNLAKEAEIEYYDYANDKRFVDDYDLFMDVDHLNYNGAKKFTNIIMTEVVNNN